MAGGRGFSGTMRNVAANRGDVPLLRIVLGLALIGFWLLALMFQIQTSEAFILGGGPTTLAANWGILKQPFELFHGMLPMDMGKAVLWGYGIEFVYLVCVVGEVSVHGRLNGIFKTGAFLLIAFDFWTDFQYGTMGSGFWGQLAFATITAFIVAFFGVVGINMVFSAILEVTH